MTAVLFGADGAPGGDQLRDEFIECADKIQVGPRILEPRRRLGENKLEDRLSKDIDRDDEHFGILTRRTIMIYDLANFLTFLTTHDEDVTLRQLAEMTSDRSFYQADPTQCAEVERKVGAEGTWDPNAGKRKTRSKSCEYWAVVLTSFEHAGMIFRGDVSAAPHRIGSTDSMIGAALIIRFRASNG